MDFSDVEVSMLSSVDVLHSSMLEESMVIDEEDQASFTDEERNTVRFSNRSLLEDYHNIFKKSASSFMREIFETKSASSMSKDMERILAHLVSLKIKDADKDGIFKVNCGKRVS